MNREENGLETKKRLIDLHLHTTNSDGEESPQEVVHNAAKAGLSLIAITDHNRFTFTRCGRYQNMDIVPGIEFSAKYHSPARTDAAEIHIVAIFPNGVDPAAFDGVLSHVGEGKKAYVTAILKDLETRGIHITMEEVQAAVREGRNVGRHGIARVLVARGLEPSVDAAFDHQIGNFSPYYIPSTRYIRYAPMEEIVRTVKDNGGIPILAHPYGYGLQQDEVEQLIRDFRQAAAGETASCRSAVQDGCLPAGMEVYYQMYLDEPDSRRVALLEELQRKYGLLASAGSDRHRPDKSFCTGGDYRLFEEMVRSLRQANGQKQTGSLCKETAGEQE